MLAADIVRLTAGRRSRHECRSLGRLTLKGLPDPVETVEVLWEPLGVDDAGPVVPLPGAPGRAPGGRCRRAATPSWRRCWMRSSGSPQVRAGRCSWSRGKPVLGKTTLIAEAARVAFDDGACVLFGHCEEDLAAPYQLFTEALGHFVTHAPEEQLVAHVESWGSELARLVPALSSRLPGLGPSTATDADTERYQVFAAVVGLLVMVSRAQPVVLVLDDLQWADRASLQLLRHLVGVDQAMRLLVLGTYRDTELSHSHPLVETLAALHRHGGVARLELAGLDDAGVASLMEAAAGHTLDDTRRASRPGVASRDRRQPVLRQRGAAPPRRDRGDLPGRRHRPLGRRGDARRDGVAGQRPHRDRRPCRAAGRRRRAGVVAGRGDRPGLRPRRAGPAPRRCRTTTCSTSSTRRRPRRWCASSPTPRGTTASPTPSSNTPCTRNSGRTRQARAHRQVAEGARRAVRRPARVSGRRAGPPLVHRRPTGRPRQGPRLLAAGRRRRARRARPRRRPAATTPRPSTSTHESDDPDPMLGIDLAIGLGTAQRQTGDAAFRDTLLDAARRAADLGDTERLVAAALANNRGMFSDRRDRRRRPRRDPGAGPRPAPRRRPVPTPSSSPHSAPSSPTAAVSSVVKHWPTMPSPSPAPPATTPPSCGSSTTSRSRLRCRSCSSSPWRGRPTPSIVPSASATRCCCSGPPTCAPTLALRAGDIDEMDRCLRDRLVARRATRSTDAELAADHDARHARPARRGQRRGRGAGDGSAPHRHRQRPARRLRHLRRATRRGDDANGEPFGELLPVIEQLSAELPLQHQAITAAHGRDLRRSRADSTTRITCWSSSQLPTSSLRPDPGAWLLTMTYYAGVAVACRDTEIAAALFDRLAPFADQVPTNIASVRDPISYFLGEPRHRPRPLRPSRRLLRPAPPSSTSAPAPSSSPPTPTWRGARCSPNVMLRGCRTGSTPPHRCPHRSRDPSLRRHRTTSRRSARTPGRS